MAFTPRDLNHRPWWCKPQPPDRMVKPQPVPRFTSLSRLAPAQKQKLWRNIKLNNPALANLLQDDSLQSLVKAFDAQILVKLDDINGHEQPQRPTRGDQRPP